MNDENQQQETAPSYVPTGQDAAHARFTFVRCYARQVIQAYQPGEDSDEDDDSVNDNNDSIFCRRMDFSCMVLAHDCIKISIARRELGGGEKRREFP